MTYVFKRKSYPPLNLLLYISGCSAAGSALDWGSRGRKFKSCHSDHVVTDFVSFVTAFFIEKAIPHSRRHFSFPKQVTLKSPVRL